MLDSILRRVCAAPPASSLGRTGEGFEALEQGPRGLDSSWFILVSRVGLVSNAGRGKCLGAHSCAFERSLVAGYLVDPASSHMLVSKIKPCMSKYKRLVL